MDFFAAHADFAEETLLLQIAQSGQCARIQIGEPHPCLLNGFRSVMQTKAIMVIDAQTLAALAGLMHHARVGPIPGGDPARVRLRTGPKASFAITLPWCRRGDPEEDLGLDAELVARNFRGGPLVGPAFLGGDD